MGEKFSPYDKEELFTLMNYSGMALCHSKENMELNVVKQAW